MLRIRRLFEAGGAVQPTIQEIREELDRIGVGALGAGGTYVRQTITVTTTEHGDHFFFKHQDRLIGVLPSTAFAVLGRVERGTDVARVWDALSRAR